MRMPAPRGPISSALASALRRAPRGRALAGAIAAARAADARAASLHDEDLELSLFVCQELHYRGIDGVDEQWEWQPGLLRLRALLESRHERALLARVPMPSPVPPERLGRSLVDLIDADDGASVSGFLARRGTTEHYVDFVTARSIYHLREADPHTWGIPRLSGGPKAALVEIQADEYGGGRPERMHATLFAATMRGLGLDDTYGAYVDDVPAVVLAATTTMSWFGLHRRRLGSLLGHLAAFETTSSLPNRRYGDGLRRLGYGTDITRFYDEHVEADAVHEQIAVHDLCSRFVEQEPARAGDVLWGAACALALDADAATHLMDRWSGSSALDGARLTSVPA